jgi:protein CpxP
MDKHFLLALIFAGVIAGGALASAQESGGSDQPSNPAGAQGQHPGHFDPARRTEMLTRTLHLSSDQQSKVQAILQSEQSQMESLRSDSSTPQPDRRAKMMEMRKASNDQVRALLDSNQQRKFDMMQSRHEGQRQQH